MLKNFNIKYLLKIRFKINMLTNKDEMLGNLLHATNTLMNKVNAEYLHSAC